MALDADDAEALGRATLGQYRHARDEPISFGPWHLKLTAHGANRSFVRSYGPRVLALGVAAILTMRVAQQGRSIEDYLEAVARYAHRAGRHGFGPLLERLRLQIPAVLPSAHAAALVHCDANITNLLVEGGTVRLVDWEYSWVGEPCSDIAELCTSPASAGMTVELVSSLIHAHVAALGCEDVVERAQAYVTVLLAYWSARAGAGPQRAKLSGAAPDPRFDTARMIDHYRDRLAVALGIDRADVEKVLAI